MKWLSRVEPVQIAVAWLISTYLKLCVRTIRWTIVGGEATFELSGTSQGYIMCFWHKVISLSVVSQRVLGDKTANAMISLSSDGSLITRIVARLGYPAVRGSRGKEGSEDKGGAGAFRQSLRLMRAGEVVAITPDGPRGPAEVFPAGPVVLARTGRVPTFMFGYACAPAFRPDTWDKMLVPLPFGRGAVVIDGPILAPAAKAEEEIAAVAAEWQERLNAAQARAEAIVAGRGD